MKTPFDDYSLELIKKAQDTSTIDDQFKHFNAFANICRVKYIQMTNSSQKMAGRTELLKKGEELYPEGVLEMSNEIIEINLNYFSFLEELNKFGRVFEKKYTQILPEYFRVRFYRNKMIEHWDNYQEYLDNINYGNIQHDGKLCIPYHFGVINFPDQAPDAYNALHNEFQKLGVNLPSLDISISVEDYSKIIFQNLETYDPRLEKIPVGLVNALFKYRFPVPIYDMDNYLIELVNWLRAKYP
jgi:hypothetical protein